jgi:hypothetical protein
MAEDLGTVNYLGVYRQWSAHPTFFVFLCQGLPAYAAELLVGDETAAQLSRPWMLSVKRKDNGLVVETGFFLTEAAAMTALKAALAARLGISQAKLDRITTNLPSFSGGNLGQRIRKWRKIDPDASGT